jgi:polyisoprenoid-binding protein YceI
MNRKMVIAVGLALLLAGPAAADPPPHRVSLLDASQIEGTIVSVSPETVQIRTSDGLVKLAVKDVASVQLGEAKRLATLTGKQVLRTTDGDLLQFDGMSSDNDAARLKLASDLLGKVELDYGRATVIYLSPTDLSVRAIEDRCQDLKLFSENFDMLVVENKEGSWIGLEGVFKGIDEKEVSFRWKQEDRQVARNRVPVVRLVAQQKPDEGLVGTLTGIDGSRVKFSSLSLDDKQARLEHPALGSLTVPRNKVAVIDLASQRIVQLSSLSPDKKTEEGFFDRTYGFRIDQAVSGKPLRLDGKTYSSGLGLHSFSELTWKLDGKYTKFVATVGIDDAVRPRGQVDLTILVDGKEVKQLQIAGTDKAQTLRVDLRNATTFTIRVGFGDDNLGAGDHLDLADARLIK